MISRRDFIGFASASTFYVFDERGNTVQRVNAEGTVTSYRAADAFGATSGSAATGDPYDGFVGQWGYRTDKETGLILCGQRYYDSATGRWLTRDPFGYSGGVNPYGFCQNNPISGIDPNGTASLIRNGPGPPHWYLQFRPGFVCHALGQSGNSAGWYPPLAILPGRPRGIILPDPHAGHGITYPVRTDNSPGFDERLCACVSIYGNPWPYLLKGWCAGWANDVWNCAKRKKDGDKGRNGNGVGIGTIIVAGVVVLVIVAVLVAAPEAAPVLVPLAVEM